MWISKAMIVLLVVLLTTTAAAQPLGTAFSYQGQLTDAGQPPTGLYDLQICLFDSPSSPATLACAPDFNDVPVEDGVFMLALDFGAAPFVGQQRFLELRVRPGASTGAYTLLAPRQLVRATPEALRANVSSAAPWSGLTGVPAGFADGIDNDGGGTVTSIVAGAGLSGGTITGSGTIGIANGGVGSAQLASGAVGTAQLAANAVGSAALADSAVDTGAIQNFAITQAKIAAGAIGSAQLALGAVGTAQINTNQVQARIAGTCVIGEYFRGVNADGSVACEPVPGVQRVTTVDDPANSVGVFSSIAIGADGLPVISYLDATAFTLKVAKCSNAACTGAATIAIVDDPAFSNVGLYTDIAIGTDGLPVVSYHDASAGALKVAKCASAACTGTATITTVDDPAVNSVGTFTSIAIGADGLPTVSYSDATAGALKVAKCANAACTGAATITTVDDPPVFVGQYTAIAIGSDGLPVISYIDAINAALKVAKCANAACTGAATITTVDNPVMNNIDGQTSIAIGADGLPVIAYTDQSAGAIKLARCVDAACSAAAFTIADDPVTGAARLPAIAIGPDGLPIISYQDSSTSALKVAKCVSAACSGALTISNVDDPANVVGTNSSIAIGIDGLPVISYYDTTAAALKVARCGTRSCQ
jgi:hypothetical protein